jgi:hypothetical protein
MTDIKKLAFVGLASLGLITFGSVGCSSSSNSGTGGSGGTSSGTGGTSSHTGGATGSGGTSAGTGGSGGAAVTVGCQMSDAPASADIATFAAPDAGLTIMGGYYTYGSTPAPQYTPGTGSITVTDVVQVAATNNYQGFGIFFNGNSGGTDCIDAHTYTGVQFDISGSLMGTGCTIQFSITDSAHSDSTVLKADGTPNDPKAAGPKGSYSPQLNVPATDFTSTPMTIKVPFTGTGAPTGGSPAITTTPLDPTKIEGVQWQLTTPVAADGGATECNLSMTLANIKFYN